MLNRRDVLTGLGAAVIAVAPGSSVDVVEVKRPLMIKVSLDCHASMAEVRQIRRYVEDRIKSTELDGLSVWVVSKGVDIEIIENPRDG